jgi:hypothetical protein
MLDLWGEYHGVYQMPDFFPYGLVAAIYFQQGKLVCDVLLPGDPLECCMLPSLTLESRGSAVLLKRPGDVACDPQLPPHLEAVEISYAGEWVLEQALEDTSPGAEASLLVLLQNLFNGAYTSTQGSITLGKLVLQSDWGSAPVTQDAARRLVHGSLWFGDYGEHYKLHRNEAVQIIRCKAGEINGLMMLTDQEKARAIQLVQSEPDWDPDDHWVFGMKVTGDPHVQMGSLSMAVCVGREKPHQSQVHDSWSDEQIDTAMVVGTLPGMGTLAYIGYRNPSWNPGKLMILEDGRWSFVWTGNQDPVVFRPLPVRDSMSFVNSTEFREPGANANLTTDVGVVTKKKMGCVVV